MLFKELRNKIQKAFDENKMPYEFSILPNLDIEVEVFWGDWKHDHARLVNFMRKMGYAQIDYQVVEDNCGDDAYSATHKFRKL